eukprot:358248-Chlamydomonas_euryale.AAC.3
MGAPLAGWHGCGCSLQPGSAAFPPPHAPAPATSFLASLLRDTFSYVAPRLCPAPVPRACACAGAGPQGMGARHARGLAEHPSL